MIRVTIELVPGGIGRPRLLGVALIANTGECTDPKRGDYTAVFATRTGKTWKTATVENYPRQAYQVWVLLHRLLKAAVRGEKSDKKTAETGGAQDTEPTAVSQIPGFNPNDAATKAAQTAEEG